MTVCNKQALSVFVLAFSGDILRQFEHMPEPDLPLGLPNSRLVSSFACLAWLGLVLR